MTRPNILLITSDQHRGDCYGFAGRLVRTPNLDDLAARSTYFPLTTTPCLVCQPARASILTGLLPLTHGLWDNGLDLDPGMADQGFAAIMARAGYATAFIGKAHLSARLPYHPTGSPEDRTSPHPADWCGPYMGFEYAELNLSGDMNAPPYPPPLGQHYERWLYRYRDPNEVARQFALRTVPPSQPEQTWHSKFPVAWHDTEWAADRTIDLLRRRQGNDQPFCVWLSFADPHHPFDCPEPWSRLHDPKDVDLPPYRSLDLEQRPWWHAASLKGNPDAASDWARGLRANFTRIHGQGDEQLAEMIANYYGMISLIDHNVGRVLNTIDDLGLRENTVVIFTSDHGDWLGDHGLLLKGPMAYEGLLTVGALLGGPGFEPGVTISSPVSLLDLPASILSAAALEVPVSWHSRPLQEVVRGEERDYAYSEWNMDASRCGVPLQLRIVRTRRLKLTLELTSGAGEMYDLAEDPFELRNVFDDTGYAGARAEMIGLINDRPKDQQSTLKPLIGIG